LQRQGSEVVRQSKDHMTVGGIEHLALPGGEPCGLGGAMTFGAAAVPAGVIRLLLMVTVVALRDMATQGGRATEHGRAQGPVLRAREGGPIALEKGITMLAHHIGHFERWATHGRVSKSAGNARASRGLSVAWSAGWATWR
jgi:hypothetical protein